MTLDEIKKFIREEHYDYLKSQVIGDLNFGISLVPSITMVFISLNMAEADRDGEGRTIYKVDDDIMNYCIELLYNDEEFIMEVL